MSYKINYTRTDLLKERKKDIIRLCRVENMRPGQEYRFSNGNFHIMHPEDIERAASTIRNLEDRWGL